MKLARTVFGSTAVQVLLLFATLMLVELSIESKLIELVKEQSQNISQRLLARIHGGSADLDNLVTEPDLAAIYSSEQALVTTPSEQMQSGQLHAQIVTALSHAEKTGESLQLVKGVSGVMIAVTRYVPKDNISPNYLVLVHSTGRLDNVIWSIRTLLILLFALILLLGALNNKSVVKRLQANRASERQELAELIEQRGQYLDLMMQLSSLMAACSSLKGAAEVVSPIAVKIAPACSAGYIGILDAGREHVMQVATWGQLEFSHDAFDKQQCWGLVKGHHHASHINDIEIFCDHVTDHVGCSLCLPLTAQGNTIGVLSMYFDDDAALLKTQPIALAMAEQIGLALANMQLREHLEHQAIIDPLTGLFNRRHMIDTLEDLNSKIIYGDNRASVIMLDVDHFKAFNDSFGHDAGDQLLTRLSTALKQSLRENDRAFRYGGEEFCIVLPDANIESAMAVADKLREKMTTIQIATKDGAAGATISAGIAMIDDSCMDTNTVLQRADRALYKAKHNGRNRVEIFTDQRFDDAQIASSANKNQRPSGND